MQPANDVYEVATLLPYRPPLLLIDRVLHYSVDQIVASKTFVHNDLLITSHLTGSPPIVAGVLLIEMVGQAAFLHQLITAQSTSKEGKVLGQCRARFIRPARPGDDLVTTAELQGAAMGGCQYRGVVRLGNEEIARIEVLAVAISQ